MAASTITRATWSDGAAGTVLNNARLQTDIYAAIDEMFAGASPYATFTFGGKVAAEGLGTHTFSAGGTGDNTIAIRNTTAGATNRATLNLGNDGSATAGQLSVLSSTYTSATIYTADGVTLAASRAGGLALAATHASGIVQIFSGGTTERARWLTGGHYRFTEISTDPTTGELPTMGALAMYMKNDKLVFAYNNGGTLTFAKLPLGGGAATFTHDTTVP